MIILFLIIIMMKKNLILYYEITLIRIKILMLKDVNREERGNIFIKNLCYLIILKYIKK